MRAVLFENQWVMAWGYSLLHSLWLGAAWAIILHVLLRFIRPSADRYLASLIVLGGFIISYGIMLAGYLPASGPVMVKISASSPRWLLTDTMAVNIETGGGWTSWIPWLVLFWTIGAFLFLIRMVAGIYYVRQIRKASSDSVPSAWKEMISRIAGDLGIGRKILIKSSLKADMPMVYGWLRPVLYLPVSLMSGLSAEQLEAIFAHELAHIRRHDFVINILQRIIESVFFFNPFVWWMSRVISQERERSCDDLAVQYCSDRRRYAEALSSIEFYRTGYLGMAVGLASNRNDLLQRIKRLIEPDYRQHFPFRIFGLALLITAAFIGLSFVDADAGKQSAEKPAVLQATANIAPRYQMTAADTVPKKQNKRENASLKNNEELTDAQLKQIEEALRSIEEIEIPDIDISALAEMDFDPIFDAALNVFDGLDMEALMEQTYAALDTNILRNDSIRSRMSREQREEMRRAMEEVRRAQLEFRENHREEMMKLREELLQQREEYRRKWMEMQEELRENLQEMELSPEERERLRHELMRSQELLQREMHRQQEAMQRMGRSETERARLEMQRQQEQLERMARMESERARNEIHFRRQAEMERMNRARDEMRQAQREMERAQFEQQRAMMERDRFGRRSDNVKLHIEEMLRADGYLDADTPLKKLKYTGDDVRYNGKKIPEANREKYLRVMKQYFGDAKASYEFSE